MGKSIVQKAAAGSFKYKELPFVSVCTPTYNRRPFIPAMLKCFDHQDYPKDRMEWIIIDDGTDPVEDLVASHPNVKYYKYDTKMPLGKKRNLMHQKSKGDIIVYFDDDDFYAVERVSHAVDMLLKNPQALCAGSSEIYIYFKHIRKMYQFGPYGPNHATAGTFAFRREMLKDHAYEDDACLAEEKAFLKNYTVPFVQLDPMKVILVFSHEHNTFDKRKLLENPNPQVVRESRKTVSDFIKDKDLKFFYMIKLDQVLKDYEPGRPEMKPDVMAQTARMEQERRKMTEQAARDTPATNGSILMHVPGKDPVALTNDQVIGLIHSQKEEIERLNAQVAYLQAQAQSQSQGQATMTNTGMTITEISETAVANSEISQDLMKKYEDAIRENLELRMEIDNLKQKIRE